MSTPLRTLLLGGALCSALSVHACGGATGDPLGRGNHNAGGGPAKPGTGSTGNAVDGGEAGDGSGGAATGAGGKGTGGSAGAGGRIGAGGVVETGGRPATGGRPDTGGAGGVPSWSCRSAYEPPIVGPRKDGPVNPATGCDTLSDAVVLARYADASAKVPTGFFYEEPGEIVRWDLTAGCSTSLSETAATARTEVGGNPDGSATTPYFYEVAMCNGEARTRYRRLRCDYYDGKHLTPMPSVADDLMFLAGLTWFAENQNFDGATLVSGWDRVEMGNNPSDVAEICTTKTTYGDFGLCDMITLTSTRYSSSVDGTVELLTIIDERTIKGRCR